MKLSDDIHILQNLVLSLFQKIEKLEAENTELRSKLNLNSNNSSKPPSTDGYKKQAAFPRKKNGKQGGQKGHAGKTLKQVENPDFIIEHKIKECNCGCNLENLPSKLAEKRQVFELPEPRLEITEHQLHSSVCPSCGKINKAKAPENITAPVQYGSGVKALAVLLNNNYKIPFKKVQSLFEDLFGYPINESTIYSANIKAYNNLEATEEIIKSLILDSKTAHADETGLRVAGVLHWLHNISTEKFTHLFIHPNRGKKALESPASVIPFFSGWLVHDCWSSYFSFTNFKHAVCGAHLLREFQGLYENDSKWAKTFKSFLLDLLNNDLEFNQSRQEHIKQRFDTICKIALSLEPEPIYTGKKGRKKRTKGRNLIERLIKHKDAVLAFAFNEEVPFTNNLAERDVRPAKLKQKISGCLRTFKGAQIYARIESFISSSRKNKINIFKELKSTLELGYNHFTVSEYTPAK